MVFLCPRSLGACMWTVRWKATGNQSHHEQGKNGSQCTAFFILFTLRSFVYPSYAHLIYLCFYSSVTRFGYCSILNIVTLSLCILLSHAHIAVRLVVLFFVSFSFHRAHFLHDFNSIWFRKLYRDQNRFWWSTHKCSQSRARSICLYAIYFYTAYGQMPSNKIKTTASRCKHTHGDSSSSNSSSTQINVSTWNLFFVQFLQQ